MYPFERFTEAAKETLTIAQQEAERSHHSYIGTEHIALALVSQQGTVASETLARLGLALDQLREQIDRVLGLNERIIIQQIIPTSRVKKVIEMAFEEARQAGESYVGTDHVLVALLVEGEGIAAHVLVDLGATLDVVRATVAQVRESGVREEMSTAQPRFVPQSRRATQLVERRVGGVVAGAEIEARRDFDDRVGDVHILRYLLNRGDRRVVAALRRFGVDPAALRDALLPPERIVELRRAVQDAAFAKRSAAGREDYAAAEEAKKKELELRRELASAEKEWEQTLHPEP